MSTAITGTVRIDLSSADDLLFLGEDAHRRLWAAMQTADDSLTFELWIGQARDVEWADARIVQLLRQACRVVVTGSDPRGVESAIRGLRRMLDGAAA